MSGATCRFDAGGVGFYALAIRAIGHRGPARSVRAMASPPMRYALKTVAAEQFAHIEPRKQREHAAENALVGRFCDEVDAGVFV